MTHPWAGLQEARVKHRKGRGMKTTFSSWAALLSQILGEPDKRAPTHPGPLATCT